MSVLTQCDICGIVDFCVVIDGLTLCDVYWSDYEQENDIEEFCDGDCRDCDNWEDCESHY